MGFESTHMKKGRSLLKRVNGENTIYHPVDGNDIGPFLMTFSDEMNEKMQTGQGRAIAKAGLATIDRLIVKDVKEKDEFTLVDSGERYVVQEIRKITSDSAIVRGVQIKRTEISGRGYRSPQIK